MAQQLKALGEEVRLLVMIDTPFPQEMPAHLTNSAAILDYLLKDKIPLSLERLNKLEPKDQIEYVLAEARMRGKSDMIPPHIGVPLFNTWIAHQEATFAYQPKNYADDVVFFRHTEKMEHFPSAPHETWLDYIEGKVEIHQVPGDHITMNYHPCVNVLAAHLKIVLKNTADAIQRDIEEAEANKLYPQSYEVNVA
jgi:thioesterase domain-containing protein